MPVIDGKLEMRSIRMLVRAMKLLEPDQEAQNRALRYLMDRYFGAWKKAA
jgi:hypothetical protein